MKKIFCVVSLLLFLVSCKTRQQIKISTGHDASEPNKGNFIKMKNGAEVKLSDEIDVNSNLMELDNTRMIKVDNKKYKGSEVAAVQVNGDYYLNSSKNTFSRRIYRGYFDIYTHTSSYTTSSYNSSTNSFGPPRTHYSKEYYLQSPKIEKGDFTRIQGFGNCKEYEPYLKTYKPSMDILKKYQDQRRVARIVKLAVAGLWVSSWAIALNTKEGTAVNNIATGNAVLGLFYVPVFSFTFKAGNHKRPFKAIQTFIDNNLDETITPAKIVTSTIDSTPIVKATETNTLATATTPSTKQNINSDFIEINNKELILANEGTKLKSANNKIFMINNQKYTSGITAFQINKKYYRHFPDMKDPTDFAQRSVNGKISAYNVVRGSQNNGNINSSNMFVGKKNTYFMKEGEEGFIKKRQNLYPYFEDNTSALAMYNDYTKHYRAFKTTYFTLLGISTATIVGLLVKLPSSAFNRNPTPLLILGGVASASSLINFSYVYKNVPKLNKEFSQSLDVYNGNKKARTKSKKR